MRNSLIFKTIFVSACFIGIIQIGYADDVFNTPTAQEASTTDFYGNPESLHGAQYYNQLITSTNKQSYQTMADQTKTKQNDPKLKALQEKMLSDDDNPGAANQKSQTKPKTPLYREAVKPKPTVIYQMPIVRSNNNSNTGSVTNFDTGGNNKKQDAGSNLGIQY